MWLDITMESEIRDIFTEKVMKWRQRMNKH